MKCQKNETFIYILDFGPFQYTYMLVDKMGCLSRN